MRIHLRMKNKLLTILYQFIYFNIFFKLDILSRNFLCYIVVPVTETIITEQDKLPKSFL
jgi:hypothetical protein